MAEMDRLLYFNGKGLGEAIRQLYILSGTEFCDERISHEEFKRRKPGKYPSFTSEFRLLRLILLVGCQRSTSPFPLRVTGFSRVIRKQMG